MVSRTIQDRLSLFHNSSTTVVGLLNYITASGVCQCQSNNIVHSVQGSFLYAKGSSCSGAEWSIVGASFINSMSLLILMTIFVNLYYYHESTTNKRITPPTIDGMDGCMDTLLIYLP